MLLNNRQIRNAFFGGLGGFLSWLLFIEPIVAPQLAGLAALEQVLPFDALFGAAAGLFIGMALGGAEGAIDRLWRRAGRGAWIGGLVGLIGGAIGLVVGELVYQPLAWAWFVGRSVGWGVFGAILGVSEGLARRSLRGVRNGALGGLIGGAVGGFLFDLMGFIVPLVAGSDALGRAVALTAVGACLGFWIAAVERALSPALLKVTSGRQEGREFLLDKPLLTLGSDERCDIALFGDPAILPRHATLRWENEIYMLEPAPGAEVTVNGQSIQRQGLQHEDQLLIGRIRTVFRRKAGPAHQRAAPFAAAPVATSAPEPVAANGWPTGFPIPATSAGPGQYLVALRTGQRFPLGPGPLFIGRDATNQIVLDDPAVSGQHAVIQYEQGRYVIHDQGSRNGVFVGGRRITGANLLRPGWQLQVGDSVFQVE